jgi:tryptophan-rich sensory protein
MFNNIIEKPIYHILIPILLAIFMNGIIYTFKINNNSIKENDPKYSLYKKMLPSGYIIGIIWTIIFGLLGYSHYLLHNINNKITFSSMYVLFLILYCLFYPIITGLNVKSGLLLNLITLILSFILGLIVINQSKYIFIYIIPLIIWTSYVNIVDVIQCSNLF